MEIMLKIIPIILIKLSCKLKNGMDSNHKSSGFNDLIKTPLTNPVILEPIKKRIEEISEHILDNIINKISYFSHAQNTNEMSRSLNILAIKIMQRVIKLFKEIEKIVLLL